MVMNPEPVSIVTESVRLEHPGTLPPLPPAAESLPPLHHHLPPLPQTAVRRGSSSEAAVWAELCAGSARVLQNLSPAPSRMSVSPGLADLSRLYQTEFVRSARAVGVLWAVCTLCFAIIQVVILVQPSWVGTTASGTQRAGPPLPSGTMGLFEVCLESDWPAPDCRGGLSSLSPLPSFQSVAMLVGVSLWAVWTSVLCLCLFRFCSAATVYKICAWLQLTAGFCLALACLLFPDSWESPEMRVLCGDSTSSLVTMAMFTAGVRLLV
ncbi:LHFPL tetraspan subfamily member 3 protein isoform X2 [Xiphophorus couchianus]|uniref:LHFPL tetraspan subfamily member 3 protein isoform X2 n=1 Tax=Xiphophorus couchianus TaxID=32473 RepID=UPI0010165B61|nr:LHFPL tetraspan subfamily member 3 protein-like isoform X2 [Xiphophorus couchianus]